MSHSYLYLLVYLLIAALLAYVLLKKRRAGPQKRSIPILYVCLLTIFLIGWPALSLWNNYSNAERIGNANHSVFILDSSDATSTAVPTTRRSTLTSSVTRGSDSLATVAPARRPAPAVPTPSPTSHAALPTASPTSQAIVPTPSPSHAALPKDVPTTNTSLLRENAIDVPLDNSPGLAREGEAVQLANQAGGPYKAKAILLSREHQVAIPFDNAVLSWNADAPAGTRLEFDLRVGDGAPGNTTDSPWFTMGTWSASGGASVGGQSDPWGRVDVDTLELTAKATSFQYRVVLSTDNPAATPRLRSVSIVYADMTKPLFGPRPTVPLGWQRDLPVPQYSQLDQDPAVARDICSPTSLAMILNFWGKAQSVRQVYTGVRDAQAGIFGNWPFNAAYASALGFDSYIDRFYSVEQLEDEIAKGQPVAISIKFQPGQLDNAPIASTTGHLIVVRGFTPQGDVIVNDPIAPTDASVRRVYKRDQLAKVWLDSGGVVYILKPR